MDQLLTALPGPMADKIDGIVAGFWRVLPNLVFALIWLLVVWLAAIVLRRVVHGVTRRARLRKSLQELADLLTRVAIWIVGLLVAATILFPSFSIAQIFAAAGVGGIALAFAAKDTLENFFAGVMLLIRETFQTGDFVECEGIEGQVERINIRDTYIRQTDGQLVVAPNSLFYQNPLTIRTSQEKRRTTVICGVAYGEDVDAAREVIRGAVEALPSVKSDEREVQIFAQEFADSSINFAVPWWTGPTPVDIRRSRDEVVAAVKRALDEAGIEIPFPYRTLTFKEPLPLTRPDPG